MKTHRVGFTLNRIDEQFNVPKSQRELLQEVSKLVKNFEKTLPCPVYCRAVGKLTMFKSNEKALVLGYHYSFIPEKNFKF